MSIDQVFGQRIGAARDLGRAIGQQLDIVGKDQLQGAIDPAIQIRERVPGFGGEIGQSLPKLFAGGAHDMPPSYAARGR
jgi:hypothetical protein